MRLISDVLPGSLASRYHIHAGDVLLSINGEPILDEIDYQALTAQRIIKMIIIRKNDATERYIELIKEIKTPLGLRFADSIVGNPKTCSNQCVFCFVDQMPQGMRKSLYVKDDDWRLSLLMGNYITLTNLGENELSRIIARRASPLYISVHTTNPDLRKKILQNQNAHLLMRRLHQLKSAGLSFHCQLVLCPGINDGKVFLQSLVDLYSLLPNCLSVAVVPVGITRYREKLPLINPFNHETAKEIVEVCLEFQHKALAETGTRFVFPADEFYCIAKMEIPKADNYENYPQIENGVGLLRQFSDEMKLAFDCDQTKHKNQNNVLIEVLLPCGTAVYPYLKEWIKAWCPKNVKARIIPIKNYFFGENVTVTGLITGRDLIKQLKGRKADKIFIIETMLNSDNELFLDDLTPRDLEKSLGIPVVIVKNSGESFYHALKEL